GARTGNVQLNVLGDELFEVRRLHPHFVGPRGKIGDDIHARRVSGRSTSGARTLVFHGDFGAGYHRALRVRDHASDGARDLLREERRANTQGKSKEEYYTRSPSHNY